MLASYFSNRYVINFRDKFPLESFTNVIHLLLYFRMSGETIVREVVDPSLAEGYFPKELVDFCQLVPIRGGFSTKDGIRYEFTDRSMTDEHKTHLIAGFRFSADIVQNYFRKSGYALDKLGSIDRSDGGNTGYVYLSETLVEGEALVDFRNTSPTTSEDVVTFYFSGVEGPAISRNWTYVAMFRPILVESENIPGTIGAFKTAQVSNSLKNSITISLSVFSGLVLNLLDSHFRGMFLDVRGNPVRKPGESSRPGGSRTNSGRGVRSKSNAGRNPTSSFGRSDPQKPKPRDTTSKAHPDTVPQFQGDPKNKFLEELLLLLVQAINNGVLKKT